MDAMHNRNQPTHGDRVHGLYRRMYPLNDNMRLSKDLSELVADGKRKGPLLRSSHSHRANRSVKESKPAKGKSKRPSSSRSSRTGTYDVRSSIGASIHAISIVVCHFSVFAPTGHQVENPDVDFGNKESCCRSRAAIVANESLFHPEGLLVGTMTLNEINSKRQANQGEGGGLTSTGWTRRCYAPTAWTDPEEARTAPKSPDDKSYVLGPLRADDSIHDQSEDRSSRDVAKGISKNQESSGPVVPKYKPLLSGSSIPILKATPFEIAGRPTLSPVEGNDNNSMQLPTFPDPENCMWTATYAANAPSEDRNSSLVNVLLRPKSDGRARALIRLSLWSVIDGHGGSIVANYVSEVLLPLVVAKVAGALCCDIADRGICTINGERRDANALDFEKLILTSAPSSRRSVQYRTPRDNGEAASIEGLEATACAEEFYETDRGKTDPVRADDQTPDLSDKPDFSVSSTTRPGGSADASGSACIASATMAATSRADLERLVGMHSPCEVTKVKSAVTESFLAVDEGWINSIDPIASGQTKCESNGLCNAGACALVAFTLQRLEQTDDRRVEIMTRENDLEAANGRHINEQSFNGRLHLASNDKSTKSLSAPQATVGDTTIEFSAELEDNETEKYVADAACLKNSDDDQSVVSSSSGQSSHVSRSLPAMLYTAWVGDCRAVMLGATTPRMGHKQSNCGVGACSPACSGCVDVVRQEKDFLSSLSQQEDDSSEEVYERELQGEGNHLVFSCMPRRARSKYSLRSPRHRHAPFIPLPSLCENVLAHESALQSGVSDRSLSFSSGILPVDLTTDHSVSNPTEARSVLRRCNNAPRAISCGSGGGIKRVAGSLTVTRALGNAYLKTPLLSFQPYKKAAPYITARPEVRCRVLSKSSDRVLLLGSDGVWEQASGGIFCVGFATTQMSRLIAVHIERDGEKAVENSSPRLEGGSAQDPPNQTSPT